MDVQIVTAKRPAHRILAVSIETLALFASLFDFDLAELQVGPMVRERRVDWSGHGLSVVAQVAVVCDAGALTAVLARRLQDAGVMVDGLGDADVDWIIEAAGRPAGAAWSGGERVGCFSRIVMDVADESATTITATHDGWIFTSPHPGGGLAVLIVAPSAMTMATTPDGIAKWLARSGRTVSPDAIVEIGRAEPVAPRLSAPLHVADRLIIGEGALALDPLRGDGTGFALRGSLLAQAVLAAIDKGWDRVRCLAHYERRIRSAFSSHLRGCCVHYRAARHSDIWTGEITAMERLAAQVDPRGERFEFRLEGVDLVPLTATDRRPARGRRGPVR